jgi:regulatory protein
MSAQPDPKAMNAALRLLEIRSRSRREIETRLRQKGHDEETIEAVLTKLGGLGLIDDARFAAEWIQSRNRARPGGAGKLRSELYAKGIARDTIESALEGVTAQGELERALGALSSRRGPAPSTREEKLVQYRRLAGFLQRRGFNWETVKAALAAHFSLDAEDEHADAE